MVRCTTVCPAVFCWYCAGDHDGYARSAPLRGQCCCRGGGTALFTPSVDIIHTITVNSNPIRLDTLIDAYGDPSDVLALRSTFVEPPDAEMVGYSVWILYRQYGLLIPVQDSGAIGPGTLLHTPRFLQQRPRGWQVTSKNVNYATLLHGPAISR